MATKKVQSKNENVMLELESVLFNMIGDITLSKRERHKKSFYNVFENLGITFSRDMFVDRRSLIWAEGSAARDKAAKTWAKNREKRGVKESVKRRYLVNYYHAEGDMLLTLEEAAEEAGISKLSLRQRLSRNGNKYVASIEVPCFGTDQITVKKLTDKEIEDLENLYDSNMYNE